MPGVQSRECVNGWTSIYHSSFFCSLPYSHCFQRGKSCFHLLQNICRIVLFVVFHGSNQSKKERKLKGWIFWFDIGPGVMKQYNSKPPLYALWYKNIQPNDGCGFVVYRGTPCSKHPSRVFTSPPKSLYSQYQVNPDSENCSIAPLAGQKSTEVIL